MNVSLPLTQARSRTDAAVSVEIPQYSRRAIVAIWAAAALPMAAARLARHAGTRRSVRRRRASCRWRRRCYVVADRRPRLAVRPRRHPRPPRAGDASLVDDPRGPLAQVPRSPRSGRVGGRVWLDPDPADHRCCGAHELIPRIAVPENRDFATLVESDAGKEFLSGAWGWYGLHPRLLPLQHRARRGTAVPRRSCFRA